MISRMITVLTENLLQVCRWNCHKTKPLSRLTCLRSTSSYTPLGNQSRTILHIRILHIEFWLWTSVESNVCFIMFLFWQFYYVALLQNHCRKNLMGTVSVALSWVFCDSFIIAISLSILSCVFYHNIGLYYIQ